MENKQTDNRSASQRISDLEQTVMSSLQTLDMMARDLMTIKEAMKLLDNKVSSIVKAAQTSQPITEDNIRKIMVDNNCQEMAAKVKTWVDGGFLGQAEQIGEDSFVVLQEIADDGAVINPRYQFVFTELKRQNALLCDKILGAKVGDIVVVQDNTYRLQILEIYTIQEPKAAPQVSTDAAPATQETAPADAAPAAPAVETATAETTTPAQTQEAQ